MEILNKYKKLAVGNSLTWEFECQVMDYISRNHSRDFAEKAVIATFKSKGIYDDYIQGQKDIVKELQTEYKLNKQVPKLLKKGHSLQYAMDKVYHGKTYKSEMAEAEKIYDAPEDDPKVDAASDADENILEHYIYKEVLDKDDRTALKQLKLAQPDAKWTAEKYLKSCDIKTYDRLVKEMEEFDADPGEDEEEDADLDQDEDDEEFDVNYANKESDDEFDDDDEDEY